MSPGEPSRVRRNRIIAIAAGVITVVAITLALASGYLGLTWLWLRPAAELLLLAELVGLIVLERHQLFEPVSEKVDETRDDVKALRKELALLSQRLESSGQMTFLSTPSQTIRTIANALREGLAREQTEPQVLRWARLADFPRLLSHPELGDDFLQLRAAFLPFRLLPGDAHDAKARYWVIRNIITLTNTESFDAFRNF